MQGDAVQRTSSTKGAAESSIKDQGPGYLFPPMIGLKSGGGCPLSPSIL